MYMYLISMLFIFFLMFFLKSKLFKTLNVAPHLTSLFEANNEKRRLSTSLCNKLLKNDCVA